MSQVCRDKTCLAYCEASPTKCRAHFEVPESKEDAIVSFRLGKKLCPKSPTTLEAAEIVRKETLVSDVPRQL